MSSVYSGFFGLPFAKEFAVPDRLGAALEANRAVLAVHAKAAQDLFTSQAMASLSRMRCTVEELSLSPTGDRIGAFAKIAVTSMRTQAADITDWGRLYLKTWSNLASALAGGGSDAATPPEAHAAS